MNAGGGRPGPHSPAVPGWRAGMTRPLRERERERYNITD